MPNRANGPAVCATARTQAYRSAISIPCLVANGRSVGPLGSQWSLPQPVGLGWANGRAFGPKTGPASCLPENGCVSEVSLALRANGPDICLAQLTGLGIRCPKSQQGQRPGRLRNGSYPNVPFVNLNPVLCRKWPGRWPSRIVMAVAPARWAGLGKRPGLRPENASCVNVAKTVA